MNRLIQILVENQKEKIELSWNHLVRFCETPPGVLGEQGWAGPPGFQGVQGFQGLQGSFGVQGFFGVQGCMGATGAYSVNISNGKKTIVRPKPRTEMPETLEFSFRFKDCKPLYEEFKQVLYKVSPEALNSIRITDVPSIPLPRLTRLKEEFVGVQEKNQKDYMKRKAKVDLLMEMAFDLGLCIEDGEYWVRDESTLPRDAYEEYGPQKETDPIVKIMCRSDTEIYKELDRAGLLQAYCPEGYRRGDSYSVNGGPMNVQPKEEVVSDI